MEYSSQIQEHKGPPVPPFLMKIANPVLKFILNSPLQGLVNKELMLITFTGRKSGKKFTTPVGTIRKGSSLIIFTHSKWWRNLIGGAPVTVRLSGKSIPGTAFPVEDPAQLKKMVISLITARGEKRAQMMGFWVDDVANATPEAVKQATHGTTFIRIDLNEGSV